MENKARKILFLSSWYPTEELPHFGVFVREHARAILTAGNDIRVLASVVIRSDKLFEVETIHFTDAVGLPTTIVKIHTRFYNLVSHSVSLQYYLIQKPMRQIISTWGIPELVHSNVIFLSGMTGHRIAGKFHIPHVITEHWSKVDSIFRMPYLSHLAKKAYQQADIIMPVSHFLKQHLSNLLPGITENRFKVVGNVVPEAIFQSAAPKAMHDGVRFCAIATWSHKKNPDKLPELFIMALGQVVRQITSPVQLTMIGGGDRLTELSALCETEGVDTRFTGYLAKEEIALELASCDFLVHASSIETFGVVVAEALMSGKPVIASNKGALPELINETNGVLCENNLEDWVQGILKAMNHAFSPEEVSSSVQAFTAEAIGKSITEVYEGVLKRGKT